MNYGEAIEWLDGHYNLEAIATGIPTRRAPTLDRIRGLVGELGDPHLRYPVVHITGTNGKGSVARLVATALQSHGLRVGLATSPHLSTVNDRLAVNGHPIDRDAFAAAVSDVADAERRADVDVPNYFEALAAATFHWFAQEQLDVAVVEVGAGGKNDSTNVVNAQVAVVTNVSDDHADLFGPTLADIATEKAGIVKEGSVLVLGETDESLRPIFTKTKAASIVVRDEDFGCAGRRLDGRRHTVDLWTRSRRLDNVELQLLGAHQADNAAVALAAIDAFLGPALREPTVRKAFADTTNPGRFEIVRRSPMIVLDGSHNVAGAITATRTRLEQHDGPFILVSGMNRGRKPVEILDALDAPRARHVMACAAQWPKSIPAAEIAAAATTLGVATTAAGSVAEAVAMATAMADASEMILVAGSLYVVAEARAALVTGG